MARVVSGFVAAATQLAKPVRRPSIESEMVAATWSLTTLKIPGDTSWLGETGWTRYKDYLTTDRQYSNFILDLEFKFNAKGNSGVFMHVGDLKDHVKSGFEVQILDTYGKKNVGNHDCGGVIGAAAPSKNMVKPAGQWNRYIITLKDQQLQVILNGEQIIDLNINKSAIKDRPTKGYISFQDEAKRIWYRNVRIKELK